MHARVTELTRFCSSRWLSMNTHTARNGVLASSDNEKLMDAMRSSWPLSQKVSVESSDRLPAIP